VATQADPFGAFASRRSTLGKGPMLRCKPTRLLRAVLIAGLASVITLPVSGTDMLANEDLDGTAACLAARVETSACPAGSQMIRAVSLERRRNRRQGPTDQVASDEDSSYAEVAGQIGPTYGDWLRLQLRVRRMTQRLLAQRTGIDHSSISRIVRGERNPTIRTATTLVRGLRGELDQGALVPRNIPATARVEYALRSDELLSEQQIGALMRTYLAMRAHDGTGPNPLNPMVGSASTPTRDSVSKPRLLCRIRRL
jgi:transcriptional regulator with XRE-family HTH domain